jgi:hypothetical protein
MRAVLIALVWLALCQGAAADQEASNVAHVAAGPYGRCYAKSVPRHIYDPEGEPRQQGRTEVYRVAEGADELVLSFDWFAQQLFLTCLPEVRIVRVGPWHRGHEARADHLALAFYRRAELVRSYSTLYIAGGEVSASVSHYSVFSEGPALTRVVRQEGVVFSEEWVVTATTVDGRALTFDPVTGEVR